MKNICEGYVSICCVELDLWEANKVSMQLALHPMEGYESQIICDGDTWMKRYEELVSPSSSNEWLALVRYLKAGAAVCQELNVSASVVRLRECERCSLIGAACVVVIAANAHVHLT